MNPTLSNPFHAVIHTHSFIESKCVLLDIDPSHDLDSAKALVAGLFTKGFPGMAGGPYMAPQKVVLYANNGGSHAPIFTVTNPLYGKATKAINKNAIHDNDKIPCRVCGEVHHPFEAECTLCGAECPMPGREARFTLHTGGTVVVAISIVETPGPDRAESSYNVAVGYRPGKTGKVMWMGGRPFPHNQAEQAVLRFNSLLVRAYELSVASLNPKPGDFLMPA